MEYDLNERGKRILQAVVQDYIRTAEPVGSRTLADHYNLDISPATIRNAMVDLEEIGLLSQPHASAGRVPTDIGLRYYVDTILEVRDISGKEQVAIDQGFSGMNHEAAQVLRHSSKVLSMVSRHLGLVLAPRFSRIEVKRLEFVRLSPRAILVILVDRSGLIQNRIVETEEDLRQDDLNRFNRYLNDILEGLTISEIKVRIVEEMRLEKTRFDRMVSRALALTRKVFDDESVEDDIYIEGRINFFDYPEFADLEQIKSLFKAFEDKSILVELLDKTLTASGIQIFIGSENELAEMEGCTLIASRYSRGSVPLGTLGVLGPTRLNYSRIIPVVDYTAKLVSHILESNL
ncbi:MAG: heat-inducible transcriptional repressor HrcA [Thermodesulfobacteriota bacterium]|nr:heat-inducible transcriptional repressor HrcA [Thermodesulfobacteriota bacterium]